MKFSEMPYERPDLEKVKAELSELTEQFISAAGYAEARELLMKKDELENHVGTLSSLASVRHSIDTRVEFYKQENEFWDAAMPELQEYFQKWTDALLKTRFRKEFEEEFGSILFVNAELDLKAFSPEIIPEMQQENDLTRKYENLIASAQIPFNGGTYTLSQLTPFKKDSDDALRLAAWKAEGQWFKDNQAEFDGIYDKLVHLRDTMGRKLGYGGFTRLGYYRMNRNCYTEEDVKRFREAVRKYLVPVADSLFREQAKRLGKEYPMNYADNALEFRSGNPMPVGTAQDILMHGRKFYDELSPETSAFFRMMLDCELMDVLSTEGKEGGGYCTDFPDYGVPFIFANFNGTQGDVEVVTHEAGHAFAMYVNRERRPHALIWPGLEGCEVHSMSMEFLAWPWAEDFFGKDAAKYRYSHLAAALHFIPYGTMVDHYQHIVYEKPEMTPAQRHAVWKELTGIYMPWQRLDGEIPFYGEGEAWQRQSHIYSVPFYYIDYCLAQTVSLQFWAMQLEDREKAWERYMAYTSQGGSGTFVELLKNAGLDSPFDEKCLKGVCEAASKWLADFNPEEI